MSFNVQCLKEIGPADFGKYLAGTFVKVKRKNHPEYHYGRMDTMGLTLDATIFNITHDKKNQEYFLHELDADFTFPKVGLYNYQKHAVLYSQTNKRQYLKGLNPDSHSIVPLLIKVPYVEYALQYAHLNCGDDFYDSIWSPKALDDIFLAKDTRTVKEKLDSIRKKTLLSVALSQNFAFSLGVFSLNPTVWFRSHRIGSVVKDNSLIITNQLFYQEAADFFEKEGFQVNVQI